MRAALADVLQGAQGAGEDGARPADLDARLDGIGQVDHPHGLARAHDLDVHGAKRRILGHQPPHGLAVDGEPLAVEARLGPEAQVGHGKGP